MRRALNSSLLPLWEPDLTEKSNEINELGFLCPPSCPETLREPRGCSGGLAGAFVAWSPVALYGLSCDLAYALLRPTAVL